LKLIVTPPPSRRGLSDRLDTTLPDGRSGGGCGHQPLAHDLAAYGGAMLEQLTTERLVLRSWRPDDAEAALDMYGAPEVARWLSPALEPVHDAAAMRLLLQQWIAEEPQLIPPSGRWAIELQEDETVVGGAVLLPLPPRGEDLEIGWQLRPADWGHGYATEAGHALADWAFRQGIDELLAVVRPANRRAEATVRRLGMEWVGETDKYYGLRLQVFRLRPADLLPNSAW
jgi:RimJ/RimL family protein N-acetyltransferase